MWSVSCVSQAEGAPRSGAVRACVAMLRRFDRLLSELLTRCTAFRQAPIGATQRLCDAEHGSDSGPRSHGDPVGGTPKWAYSVLIFVDFNNQQS